MGDAESLQRRDDLSKEGLMVSGVRKPALKYMVYDVSSGLSDADFVSEMWSSNFQSFDLNCFSEGVKVVDKSKSSVDGLSNSVIEASEAVFPLFRESVCFFADWSSFKVKSWDVVSSWISCFGIGHTASDCNSVSRC